MSDDDFATGNIVAAILRRQVSARRNALPGRNRAILITALESSTEKRIAPVKSSASLPV
jgi:hypothetical protein